MFKVVHLWFAFYVLLFSCVSRASELHDISFWQKSEGHWVSENTYLAPGYDHRIKLYHSIIDITLESDLVIILETKFYPPGKFNGAYLGLDISADSGVEFVQVTRGKLRENSQVVDILPDALKQSDKPSSPVIKTKITVLNSSNALMTVSHPAHSNTDSYRIFISMPTESYRYTTSIGINNDSGSEQEGSMRGLSVSAAKRIGEDDVASEVSRLRVAHNVDTRVKKVDGKFIVEQVD